MQTVLSSYLGCAIWTTHQQVLQEMRSLQQAEKRKGMHSASHLVSTCILPAGSYTHCAAQLCSSLGPYGPASCKGSYVMFFTANAGLLLYITCKPTGSTACHRLQHTTMQC